VVASAPVRSVLAAGSDGPVGAVGCPSRNAESSVERTTAAAIAPASTTGAATVVRANSAHGESPAWVRPTTR
jgi:hypothetical protein